MSTKYVSSALIEGKSAGARTFLAALFWIWGLLGLLINAGGFLSLGASIGVGTSAYMAAGSLFWIGGMVLFGIGALISSSDYEFKRPADQN
jgi:hypothetical protein